MASDGDRATKKKKKKKLEKKNETESVASVFVSEVQFESDGHVVGL